jgi:signal-transduction protein with cAMP-binding, CBS, and nucleotidyltransferase domain
MTSSAQTIQQGKFIWEALKLMQKDPKRPIMMLPVLDDDKVVGILHMHAIIQAGIL